MSYFPFKPDRENFNPPSPYSSNSSNRRGGKAYFRSLVRYTFFLVFFFLFVFGITFVFLLRENPSYQMIDLRGRNVLEAIQWLQDRSLKPMISERIDPNFPRYQVIEQSPDPGATVKENRTVSLVVSYGGNQLVMPNYRGSNYEEAYQSLLAYLSGYQSIPQVTKVEKYSDLEEGLVVDHYPRYNNPINFQEGVFFVVSRGIATNQLYAGDYINQDFLAIEETLLSYGVRVRAKYLASKNKSLAGKIVEQSIDKGTKIQPGMIIHFTVGYYDSQVTQSQSLGSSKVDVVRLYKLQIPIQSGLNEFSRNLNNNQEVYFAQTNQQESSGNLRSVLIELDDQTGKRILFNDYVSPGEKFNLPYRSLGRGSLKILIDGKVFETVSFD